MSDDREDAGSSEQGIQQPERPHWLPSKDAPDTSRQGASEYNPSPDPLDNPSVAVQLQPGAAIGCARAMLFGILGVTGLVIAIRRLLRRTPTKPTGARPPD